jgi:hypothetical protein
LIVPALVVVVTALVVVVTALVVVVILSHLAVAIFYSIAPAKESNCR